VNVSTFVVVDVAVEVKVTEVVGFAVGPIVKVETVPAPVGRKTTTIRTTPATTMTIANAAARIPETPRECRIDERLIQGDESGVINLAVK
jgi:hypothetical protein